MAADEPKLSWKDKVFQEAKRRFRTSQDWESDARKLFLEDIKFDAADPDNGYQWPNSLLANRNTDDRPSLTINKTHQHNLLIINDGKQNTPMIKIRPVGGSATADSADVFNGICRRIEYQSNAKAAYDTAYSFAVRGGIGYWRIYTDYVHDDSFDQDLFIGRIKNPLAVYLDPDINEQDGSDGKFGFVFEEKNRDEVLDEFPELKDKLTSSVIGDPDTSWITTDKIRIAEYYRKVRVTDHLVLLTEPLTLEDGSPNPNAGNQSMVKASEVPKQILDLAKKAPDTKIREISREVVEWFKIVGEEIVDSRTLKEKNEIPIPYIPIVRVIGEETVIDGKLDRKGHTRAQKDPQRMLNYQASAAVEFGALQPKMPYMAPARAIEGYETYWRTANRINHDVLPFNDIDDSGKPIAAPQRQQPPAAAPAFLQGMQDAERQLMMVSGQYQAQMGDKENATSGKAINARQRQGDSATYHYIDNLAMAIRLTGKILVAWIPHVYDTPRAMKIMAEDGTESEVQINPQQQQSLVQKKDRQNKAIESIFNPNVGRYDVQADVGPGYATKRQEAFNALSQVAIANPAVMGVVGDYVFKAMDVPYSDDMAERFKRSIPANILGEGPSPDAQQLMEQLENVKGLLSDTVTELAEKELELKRARADKTVDSYKAETERVGTLAKLGLAPESLASLITQAVHQALTQPWPPENPQGQPTMDMGAGQDLPPMNMLPWDERAQVDASLSNGNPNG